MNKYREYEVVSAACDARFHDVPLRGWSAFECRWLLNAVLWLLVSHSMQTTCRNHFTACCIYLM
jgi:hypothetical protein